MVYQYILSISILIITVPLLIIKFSITFIKRHNSITYRKSKLILNLLDDIPKAELAFKKRIKASFPIGMSEKELIQELEYQDFRIIYSENGDQPYAERGIPSGLFCVNYWRIIWQTSEQGNITLIDGSYRDFICL